MVPSCTRQQRQDLLATVPSCQRTTGCTRQQRQDLLATVPNCQRTTGCTKQQNQDRTAGGFANPDRRRLCQHGPWAALPTQTFWLLRKAVSALLAALGNRARIFWLLCRAESGKGVIQLRTVEAWSSAEFCKGQKEQCSNCN